MRVTRSGWLFAAAGLAVLASAGFSVRAADTGAYPALQQLDAESQALYKQISASLVRVNVVQSQATVLDPTLREEYEKWRASQPVGGGPGQGGSGRGRRERGGMGGGGASGNLGIGNPNAGGQGGRGTFGPPGGFGGGPPGGFSGQGGGPGGRGGYGGPQGGSVAAFLQTKIQALENQQPQSDEAKAEIDRLRTLQLHLALVREGIQGDMNALLLDNQGDVLVLAGLLREAHTDPLGVTLSGGATVKAKFIGSNLYSGYTILQLDNVAGLKPAHLNAQGVRPAQLLMNISSGSMSLSWGGGKPAGGGPGDDRGGTFVFDIQGGLVNAIPGGAGWQADRGAIPAARLEREIAYIEHGGPGGKPTDLEPRELGFTFGPPVDLGDANTKALAGRWGVKVTSVTASSLAEKAGIKPGDVILSIDKHPISELVSPDGRRQTPEMLQLRLGFVTRAADNSDVPVDVIQGGVEKSVQVKLN